MISIANWPGIGSELREVRNSTWKAGYLSDAEPDAVDIRCVNGGDDLVFIKTLFIEYAENQGYERCFERFDEELAGLPTPYLPPTGGMWLARVHDNVAGCIALGRYDDDAAELKRLFVRPAFRGHNLGTRLLGEASLFAQETGYRRLVLETLPDRMRIAQNIYRNRGFVECPPLSERLEEGITAYELDLCAE